MKTKIYKVVIIGVIPVLYFLLFSGFNKAVETTNEIKISSTPSVSVPKDFTNFILNVDYNDYCSNPGANWLMENHIGEYGPVQNGGELNFNGVHIYDTDTGTCALGWFNKGIETGQLNKTNYLIDIAHQNGLKAIYERSNISNLCYAQRLVYEVVNGSSTTVNDGFCYQTCRGKYEIEPDGTTAIHACVNPLDCNIENWDGIPQNICESIYENLQHSDLPGFRPQARDVWDWHLKPRMKIKQQDFNINDTRPVVSIIPVRFDGTEMTPVTIRVNNFRNDSGAYSGEYKEKFTFLGPLDSLWIPGDMNNGLNKGWNEDLGQCQVDFKIKWEGNVDVWFDKLTVDDYRANKLFAPFPFNYDQFIDQELSAFSGSSDHKMDIFFIDETVHSNIPCIKYVTDYIRQNSPGTYISCATTNYLNVHGLKNNNLGFRPFLEAVHPDYFQEDSHELGGWKDEQMQWTYGACIPISALPNVHSQIPDWWKVSNTRYTEWLQNEVLGDKNSNTGNNTREQGSFIYQMHLARTQANQYSPGTRFIAQPQIHAFLYYESPNGEFNFGLREPLNEEIEAQAMLSIAHGADGLCWFWFNSFLGSLSSTPNLRPYYPYMGNLNINPQADWLYDAGLVEFDNYTKREHNLYDQNKWDYVATMNAKILTWKPTLDAVTWQSGWSVHSEYSSGAFTNKYIYDIQSIDPHSRDKINVCMTAYRIILATIGLIVPKNATGK
jgi:hypothetical protein